VPGACPKHGIEIRWDCTKCAQPLCPECRPAKWLGEMLCPECLKTRENQRRLVSKIVAPVSYLKHGLAAFLVLAGVLTAFFGGIGAIQSYFLNKRYAAERPAAPYFKAKIHGSNRWVSLHELEGSVIVLDFWAGWCAPCIELVPVFRQLQTRYADKNVFILGVNQDDKTSDFLAALEKHDILWPQSFDAQNPDRLSKLFGVTQLPTTVIIDKHGRIYKSWGKWDRKLSYFIDFLLDRPS